MEKKKKALKDVKFVVFADLGYNGGYIDVFENEETAREYGKQIVAEDDYRSITIVPVKDGLEYYGELKGLSEYYDL